MRTNVRLIHNAIIEPKGAGFTEKDGWNFLASTDEWVGPVHAEVGPDGALWVADWYNFIIQHNVFVERQAPSNMVLPFKDQPRGQGNAFISRSATSILVGFIGLSTKKRNLRRQFRLPKTTRLVWWQPYKAIICCWRMTAQRLIVESKIRRYSRNCTDSLPKPMWNEIA